MGTRADFYVGRDEKAEWLGSIGRDGYRDGIPDSILEAKSEAEYRAAVSDFFSARKDATTPNMGWPWPWDTSATTDCSYWFFDGQVWDEAGGYCPVSERAFNDDGEPVNSNRDQIKFPDMSDRKNVTLGARSGLIVIRR